MYVVFQNDGEGYVWSNQSKGWSKIMTPDVETKFKSVAAGGTHLLGLTGMDYVLTIYLYNNNNNKNIKKVRLE